MFHLGASYPGDDRSSLQPAEVLASSISIGAVNEDDSGAWRQRQSADLKDRRAQLLSAMPNMAKHVTGEILWRGFEGDDRLPVFAPTDSEYLEKLTVQSRRTRDAAPSSKRH